MIFGLLASFRYTKCMTSLLYQIISSINNLIGYIFLANFQRMNKNVITLLSNIDVEHLEHEVYRLQRDCEAYSLNYTQVVEVNHRLQCKLDAEYEEKSQLHDKLHRAEMKIDKLQKSLVKSKNMLSAAHSELSILRDPTVSCLLLLFVLQNQRPNGWDAACNLTCLNCLLTSACFVDFFGFELS